MTQVILDTNALLLFAQGTDVFSGVQEALNEPFEFVVPEAVLKELESLAHGTGRDARAAKLAHVLVQQKLAAGVTATQALKTVRSSGDYADDAILKIAEDGPSIVVTLDKELQGRLLKNGIRVLTIKNGRFAPKEV